MVLHIQPRGISYLAKASNKHEYTKGVGLGQQLVKEACITAMTSP